MPTLDIKKIATEHKNLYLRVAKGHFATSNSHSNYYIDVVSQKSRLSEAKAVAEQICSYYRADTIVDTILCLDGTEVIGACLADSLTKSDFANMNAHKTIYVISPEITNGGQMIFRDNLKFMIKDKNVLILAVSVSSGKTIESAINTVKYYEGSISAVSAVFSTMAECDGYPIKSVFNPKNLQDYFSCPAHDCPLCKDGKKLDALVNSHGFSKI